MPTIGHTEFGLADSAFAFALGDFERDNFLPLVFVREEAALDIAFRFAAMRFFMLVAPAHHTSCDCGGTRCTQRVGKVAAALPPG
jgi:hypothetical protein